SNDEWLETKDATFRAPVRRTSFVTLFMSPVGQGSKIYFSPLLASVQNGSVDFSQAPETGPTTIVPPYVRDCEGALWLPTLPADRMPNDTKVKKTVRLGENGPLQEFENNAWPLLLDQSNNIWLAEMGLSRPRCHFWIWRDGKITQEFTIPA